MPTQAIKEKPDNGPGQKAPGYDDTVERDTGHDPAIDDPETGSAPVQDPDTEGQMGQTDDDRDDDDEKGSNFSIGG